MLCVIVGCSKRSGRDKDVSFYRIPKVVTGKGESILQLTTKHRASYLSAIQRLDLTQKIICNDRICSRHFISGKPAALEEENNPDWLPTLHLGHSKAMTAKKAETAKGRFERVKLREAKKRLC